MAGAEAFCGTKPVTSYRHAMTIYSRLCTSAMTTHRPPGLYEELITRRLEAEINHNATF